MSKLRDELRLVQAALVMCLLPMAAFPDPSRGAGGVDSAVSEEGWAPLAPLWSAFDSTSAEPQPYEHGQPTALEQWLLELINAARADPAGTADSFGIGLNDGLSAGSIAADPKAPLAFHPALIDAARGHSQWMLDTDVFSHTGAGGSTPKARMEAAGYSFVGAYAAAENIGFSGTTGTLNPVDALWTIFEGLFLSPGHRVNTLSESVDEVGLAAVTGLFTDDHYTYNTLMVTENFARSAATPSPMLTGVIYEDANHNGLYDPGEGIPDITVTPVEGSHFAVTSASGGYAFPAHAESVAYVRAYGEGFGASRIRMVNVGTTNVKLDFRRGEHGAAPSDFNADGRSDLLWRHPTDGRNALWLLNGPTLQGNAYLPTVGSGWTVVARGDFDGDGRADLLWREAVTGRNAVWLMNGTALKGSGYLSTVAGTTWSVVAAGDYDGDGKADLVWRDSATGRNAVWLLNGTTLKSSGNLPGVAGTSWALVASGDFDGDGKSDLLWREAASGRNAVWLLNGSAVKSSGYLPDVGGTWSVVASGDYDGDGQADLVWRDSATGRNAVWLLNGSSLKSSGNLPGVTGTAWAVVAGGDYDGDGRGDLLWREAASGRNALWYLNGTALRASAYLPNVAAPWTPVPEGVAVR